MQAFADLAHSQTSSNGIDENVYEEIDNFLRYMIPATSLRIAYKKKQEEKNLGYLKELQVTFNFSVPTFVFDMHFGLQVAALAFSGVKRSGDARVTAWLYDPFQNLVLSSGVWRSLLLDIRCL